MPSKKNKEKVVNQIIEEGQLNLQETRRRPEIIKTLAELQSELNSKGVTCSVKATYHKFLPRRAQFG